MKINILEYFEATLNSKANQIAIIDGAKKLTFRDLNEKSKILACTIKSQINFINAPIAVYLPKGIECVISDIAIAYSGNCYMNLDTKTPTERIKNIVNLIRPKIIITNSDYLKNLDRISLDNISIINIDNIDWNSPIQDIHLSSLLHTLIDTDPLCIINTSGSTGTPKGVVLNHKNFLDFTEWALETFRFNDHEVIGSLSPSVFDIYSFELCLMMAKGSCIVIIPEHLSAFPASILQILVDTRVSFIFWVPTIMVNIANMNLLEKFQLPDLKIIWFAGEVFPTKQFNYWRKQISYCQFVNLYGPIEITLDCTYYIVERDFKDEEPIPIGFPCKNTSILILDGNNNITKVNQEGELCVRGTSLAMGYYNNPEKTSTAFVQNPLNHSYPEIIYKTGDMVFINNLGEIVFKGRKDSLVKHMGYRVELGEIEHIIINKLKLVKNGCVVYNHSKKDITLFYESEQDILPVDFRKAIGVSLPKYMIPTVYHRLDVLNRNTNGKIDRLFYNKLVDTEYK